MKDAGHIAMLACAAALAACGDCPDAFELRAERGLAPGQRVVLIVSDGELRVGGRERTRAIEIEATGCGAGQTARVVVDSSARAMRVHVSAPRADVRVDLPAAVPLEIRHGAGDVELRATGPVTLHTVAGRAVVEQVIGDVRVVAGSGALYVRQVIGDVHAVDAAGALFVEGVAGSVRIRDGSGGIHVRDVEGDVVIEVDGDGAIEVRGVGGDLDVRDKRGDARLIRYGDVSGVVRLPAEASPAPSPVP